MATWSLISEKFERRRKNGNEGYECGWLFAGSAEGAAHLHGIVSLGQSCFARRGRTDNRLGRDRLEDIVRVVSVFARNISNPLVEHNTDVNALGFDLLKTSVIRAEIFGLSYIRRERRVDVAGGVQSCRQL